MPSSFSEVARAVAARVLPGMRVAVDGVTGAGKSLFADALVPFLDAPVVRMSIDDFHRPAAERVVYPEDSFDEPAFRSAVERARFEGVLLVDGLLVLKPELRDLWDLTIFLTGDRRAVLERAIARDAARGMENARERHTTRYFPGETRYLRSVRPESCADLVVDNTDFTRPRLLVDSSP